MPALRLQLSAHRCNPCLRLGNNTPACQQQCTIGRAAMEQQQDAAPGERPRSLATWQAFDGGQAQLNQQQYLKQQRLADLPELLGAAGDSSGGDGAPLPQTQPQSVAAARPQTLFSRLGEMLRQGVFRSAGAGSGMAATSGSGVGAARPSGQAAARPRMQQQQQHRGRPRPPAEPASAQREPMAVAGAAPAVAPGGILAEPPALPLPLLLQLRRSDSPGGSLGRNNPGGCHGSSPGSSPAGRAGNTSAPSSPGGNSIAGGSPLASPGSPSGGDLACFQDPYLHGHTPSPLVALRLQQARGLRHDSRRRSALAGASPATATAPAEQQHAAGGGGGGADDATLVVPALRMPMLQPVQAPAAAAAEQDKEEAGWDAQGCQPAQGCSPAADGVQQQPSASLAASPERLAPGQQPLSPPRLPSPGLQDASTPVVLPLALLPSAACASAGLPPLSPPMHVGSAAAASGQQHQDSPAAAAAAAAASAAEGAGAPMGLVGAAALLHDSPAAAPALALAAHLAGAADEDDSMLELASLAAAAFAEMEQQQDEQAQQLEDVVPCAGGADVASRAMQAAAGAAGTPGPVLIACSPAASACAAATTPDSSSRFVLSPEKAEVAAPAASAAAMRSPLPVVQQRQHQQHPTVAIAAVGASPSPCQAELQQTMATVGELVADFSCSPLVSANGLAMAAIASPAAAAAAAEECRLLVAADEPAAAVAAATVPGGTGQLAATAGGGRPAGMQSAVEAALLLLTAESAQADGAAVAAKGADAPPGTDAAGGEAGDGAMHEELLVAGGADAAVTPDAGGREPPVRALSPHSRRLMLADLRAWLPPPAEPGCALDGGAPVAAVAAAMQLGSGSPAGEHTGSRKRCAAAAFGGDGGDSTGRATKQQLLPGFLCALRYLGVHLAALPAVE